jgi:hypothetical protein
MVLEWLDSLLNLFSIGDFKGKRLRLQSLCCMHVDEKGNRLVMTRFYLGCWTALVLAMACSRVHSQETIQGVIESFGDAVPEVRLAADSGDTCRLAVVHYYLKDIPNPEIVKLFEQCSKAGDARGTMWMARMYFGGRCGVKPNETLAQQMAAQVFPKVLELAKGGDREAQLLVGAAYHEGMGVATDYKEAAKWYAPAAEAGQLGALNNLGVLYVRGYGVTADVTKARALMSAAAERGFKDASKSLDSIRASSRDDSARLKEMFKCTFMNALGKQQDEGLAFLLSKGLISDPKKFRKDDKKNFIAWRYISPDDGMCIFVDKVTGRISSIEGYGSGYLGEAQFKGNCPLGITWSDTATTAREKLGSPSDSGSVSDDHAYGMAYNYDNLIYAVMFWYDGGKTLKVWRVKEKWARDYSAFQNEKDIIPDPSAPAATPPARPHHMPSQGEAIHSGHN